MNLGIKDWNVVLSADEDGHLFVAISHVDGTKVRRCECDIAGSNQEWADRFTTDGIEREYLENQ